MDGRTDRQRNKYTCFAWAGGTCPRFAWAGETFFPVVLLCQFLVLAITTGKKSYSRLSGGLCCCVSFWFWREIGSFSVVAGKFYYDRKKKVPVICLAGCAVVSVFGSGGKSAVFCCGGKVLLRPEKKVPVVWRLRPEKKFCCVSFWFRREIISENWSNLFWTLNLY